MGCKLSTGRTAGTLNARTSVVMRSSDALQDAAAELFGVDDGYAVVSSIQLKREVSSNAELLQLVQVQLKSTMEGLHCLDNLECFLTKLGRDMVNLPFMADGTNGGAELLHKVKDFKAIMGDRAAMRLALEDYEQAFSRQLSLLRELHLRRSRLDRKLRKVKACRKAWNIVYSTVKFAVIVLSVVLPVLTAPPAATAVANGVGGVMPLLQQWIDSKWDDHQSSCEAERELTERILNEASLAFHGFKDVGVLLRHLEVQIASLTHHAELAIEEDDEDPAARMVVERMKRMAANVMASEECLEKKVDRRREELRRTALTLLQSVTDQAGNFFNGESKIPVRYEN